MRTAILSVLCLAVIAVVLAEQRVVLLEENHYFNPSVWTQLKPSAPAQEITFNLFLRQQNLDLLNKQFERLTTPGSPEWRHWWPIDRTKALVAPPLEEKLRVRTWLLKNGARNVQDFHDALKVTTTVEVASSLFHTSFYQFEHIQTGTIVTRHLGKLSIPAGLEQIIQFTTGISEFPFAARRFGYSRDASRDDTKDHVVPYVIDQLYAIPWEDKSEVTRASSVCVAEFQGDRSFSQSDLNKFQTDNLLPVQPVPNTQIIGPYNPSIPDAEATLDIQYAWGVSYNTSAWFWTVEGWMLDFALEFQTTSPVPDVVSMSWGWTEDSQCQITSCTNSNDYVNRVNAEFQIITMSGVTLTASSGDQGAPGDGDSNCLNTREPVSSIFPGASPYVLSIGATMLVDSSSKVERREELAAQPVPPICNEYQCADVSTLEEVACSIPDALITTGGGFSNYATLPSWQASAVNAYLSAVPASELPPTGDYNPKNRGFPDVSALGHNYLIAIDGKYEIVDGTSCSAPVWGGLVALWNNYEAKQGRPTLGFINPLMYSAWSSQSNAFFDIVNGDNKCSESKCCEYGYVTAAGWDPVTGLGSPNFPVLYSYVQSQSSKLYVPPRN